MHATVVIPARLRSSRLPEKVLLASTGMPLVQHVVERVRRCTRVNDIVVAADDQRIVDALKPFGTRVVLTDPSHPSGTDRIAEVARGLTDDLIVNVQGDEPEIEPSTVDALIARMDDTGHPMGTVVTPFASSGSGATEGSRDMADPNIVKAVLALDGTAIYFSRHAIPFHRDRADPPPTSYHHVGIYGYRRAFLLEFAAWSPTPLEQSEKLEQLRAIEHGVRIDTIRIRCASPGIDTVEQYAAFVRRCSAAGKSIVTTFESDPSSSAFIRGRNETTHG